MTAPDIPDIPLADLAATWRTLLTAAEAYHWGSHGNVTLIEARRLIEVEVRQRYGDDAWSQLVAQ